MAEPRATRSELLAGLVTQAVLSTRMGWKAYTQGVVDHYHATVATLDRLVEFRVATTADNAEKASRHNTQIVRRFLSGEYRMLVDLEESLIAALPPAERDRVMSVLLERNGLLLARKPPADDGLAAQVAAPCELMRQAATAVERIAPMLANGRIGPEDDRYFVAALQALNAVMGVCITIITQIAQATTQVPARGRMRAVN